VNVVSLTPIFSRCRRATSSSNFLGRVYTPILYVSLFFHRSSCASVWLAKLLLITKLGWPVAQPRFTSRPSARTKMLSPVGNVYISTCGLMLVRFASLSFSRSIWISLSKCPMLHTIPWSFVTLEHMRKMKEHAIVGQTGPFVHEIQVERLQ